MSKTTERIGDAVATHLEPGERVVGAVAAMGDKGLSKDDQTAVVAHKADRARRAHGHGRLGPCVRAREIQRDERVVVAYLGDASVRPVHEPVSGRPREGQPSR